MEKEKKHSVEGIILLIISLITFGIVFFRLIRLIIVKAYIVPNFNSIQDNDPIWFFASEPDNFYPYLGLFCYSACFVLIVSGLYLFYKKGDKFGFYVFVIGLISIILNYSLLSFGY